MSHQLRKQHLSGGLYLRGLLIVLVVYTLFGALTLQSVELQRSLGDAAVRDSTLESAI